jgi:beta-lactamase class A
LAILIGRLGLTVFQAKEEYVKALKLRQTRDLRQLEEFLKQVVLKYTGNSETLMFERDSPTAHCHT